ncbi:hypothetical protein [Terasakiella pusilla]|uniref:hypothetical protein n=1 Tax=Terasakiella pusilla TaxID=64973 RepID=UPI003AA86096
MKKAARLYDIIVRIEDASQAYWKYNRALKAVNESREKWLKLDKDAKKLRLDYNDLKKKYQRDCGK